MGKKIVNIGAMDVRKVKKELASKISLITNIGTYITNDDSENILVDVEKKNIGKIIKTNEEINLLTINGHTHLHHHFFESITGEILLTINGVVTIDKDVDPVLFNRKVYSGSVNGVMTIPSNMSGIVKTKLSVNGSIFEYDHDKTYLDQKTTLNEDFFVTYFGDSKIALKTLIALDFIDLNDFQEIFESIQVLDKLVITKENIKKLKPYLKVNQNKVVLLEAPVHYMSGNVNFDDSLLALMDHKNLMVDGELTIKDASSLSRLGEYKIEAKKILCHKADHDRVKSYCKKSSVNIGFIESQPFGNYSDMLINKDYILALKELKIIANYGTISFDKDINEIKDTIMLLQIKNYGNISIPDEMNQSMYDLFTENFGTINSEEGLQKKGEESDVLYGNMGYLEL